MNTKKIWSTCCIITIFFLILLLSTGCASPTSVSRTVKIKDVDDQVIRIDDFVEFALNPDAKSTCGDTVVIQNIEHLPTVIPVYIYSQDNEVFQKVKELCLDSFRVRRRGSIVIQVATFIDKENASEFARSLESLGFEDVQIGTPTKL